MNSDRPLISCIIIFFNAGEQFFIEAIESIFAQTYDNWELLLVDDGSSDGSTNIALQYAQKHPVIRYLEHKEHQNRGMSATRNLGIYHAKGKYIAFLDADDLWLPNTLKEQSAILESYPDAAMVFGPIQWWYSWTRNLEDTNRDFIENWANNPSIQINTIIQPPEIFLLLLKVEIAISGMLVRKQIIEQVGGFEEQFRGLYEDQIFCSKICLQFSVFISDQCWYKYRQHPNSCCSIAEKAQKDYGLINRFIFLNWLKQYLLKLGFKNTEGWKIIKKELWQYRHPRLNLLQKNARHIINRIKWKLKCIVK